MSKWRACGVVGPSNEQAGITWVRNGIAALGEPVHVYQIEYYADEKARDEYFLSEQPPRFAK